ncbi:MAG: PAS domain S-box protein [Chloroflexota bacterium]
MGPGLAGRYFWKSVPGLKSPHWWVAAAVFLVLTLSHFSSQIAEASPLHISLPTMLGLERHSLERFLYLLLVLYSGWFLGIAAAAVLWLASAGAMLVRALAFSVYPLDALAEGTASLAVSALAVVLIRESQQARERHKALEGAMRDLEGSRRDLETLFTNASDAIWVHDMGGTIVLANQACEAMTGYSVSYLVGRQVTEFLTPEALELARDVKGRLLRGEQVEQRYDQRIKRKDGSEAIVQLATRLAVKDGQVYGFQNMARDITEETRLRDNLRFYLRECLKAQEEERKRLACELHDDTAQILLLLSHEIDRLSSEVGWRPTEEVQDEVERLHRLAQDVYDGVRRYAQALRPRILDDLGLVPALQWLVQETSGRSGIKINAALPESPQLPPETQLVLFRIAQEALNNIQRHSEATEASVSLELRDDRVNMAISDNGRGFDLPGQLTDFAGEGKLGLTGMAERAHLVGGRLNIVSRPGEGTLLRVEAPSRLF